MEPRNLNHRALNSAAQPRVSVGSRHGLSASALQSGGQPARRGGFPPTCGSPRHTTRRSKHVCAPQDVQGPSSPTPPPRRRYWLSTSSPACLSPAGHSVISAAEGGVLQTDRSAPPPTPTKSYAKSTGGCVVPSSRANALLANTAETGESGGGQHDEKVLGWMIRREARALCVCAFNASYLC